MPRGQVKASADVFVGCSSQFLKLPWKPSPREIITKALEGRVLADGCKLHVNVWDDWSKRHAGFEIFGMLEANPAPSRMRKAIRKDRDFGDIIYSDPGSF